MNTPPATLSDQLRQAFRAGHRVVRIATPEEDEALSHVRTVAMHLNLPAVQWSATRGLRDAIVAGPGEDDTAVAEAGLKRMLRMDDAPRLYITQDLLPHLDHPGTLRAWRDLVARLTRDADAAGRLVMIDPVPDAPAVVEAFSTLLEPPLPAPAEIESIVRRTLRRLHRESPIQVDLSRTALDTIIRTLSGLSRRQIESILTEVVAEDRRLDEQDIRRLLAAKRRALRTEGVLEFVEAPASLDRVGGLKTLKAWLRQRAACFAPEAADFGLVPPRGVLLLGVQGAGKSLCAKAIATAWNRALLRLDAGALYDRYIGESERRLRQAFHQAELMAPVVLWIDEIEKAFASAGSHASDGGLSRRMFGSLLTWMQEHRAPVFLVATANDIESLPPELLRKGRFDEIFFIDLPDRATRREIFAIHLERRGRPPADFDLDALADAAEGFSGAEIEQAIIAALYRAFEQSATLDTATLLQAVRSSPPLSVTMRERLEALRAWGRARCTPAD
jgi:ATP-dependent 26S proteasome regulatory subunit